MEFAYGQRAYSDVINGFYCPVCEPVGVELSVVGSYGNDNMTSKRTCIIKFKS